MKQLIIPIAVFLIGCSNSDERYDSGYSDGYAAGYNTTCKIRATLVEGDWEDKNYKKGYDAGYKSGAEACKKSDDYKG